VENEVIITGANGLVGSYVAQHLSSTHSLISFDISDPDRPIDITNKDVVMKAVSESTAEYIVHFAAFTDVTAAWEQSGDTSGIAYKVNVLGTQYLVDACNEAGKHLIHTSTSYVFDGEKADPYVESDPTSPIEWYGETKALAEQYITEHAKNWTIFRIDQPFRPDVFPKKDLPHKIIDQLSSNTLTPQFSDHYFGPTWIPDYAKVIAWAIRTKPQGLFHATNGETWTNLQYAQEIARAVGSSQEVQGSSLTEYLKTQNRPYQKNTALNCGKLQNILDFKQTPIAQAISLIER
jgi:dTDP-4-dehydrorhamnose reductase